MTILFSDIEDYTGMTERLGDRRTQEVMHAYNAIVHGEVAANGGFEVKSLGDGCMVAFRSACRALQCAIALQRGFSAYSARHPDEPMRVRIGLHTGEVIKEADDFYGKAVIQAARIASQARGGEILVFSLCRELTESRGDFQFAACREVELKGLSGMHQVHSVAW